MNSCLVLMLVVVDIADVLSRCGWIMIVFVCFGEVSKGLLVLLVSVVDPSDWESSVIVGGVGHNFLEVTGEGLKLAVFHKIYNMA